MRGALYFATFIDDFSCKVWVYPMKAKDEVLLVFQRFVTLVETQTSKKVKCLRFDNGGAFVSKEFQYVCDAKVIKREITAPYNPPQNGVSKRTNRTIQEKVKSMMSKTNSPNGFWAKTLATIAHVTDKAPNKKLDLRVAKDLWTRKSPSCKHLRVFGCEAYCHIPKDFQGKLSPKSKNCILLGYGEPIKI